MKDNDQNPSQHIPLNESSERAILKQWMGSLDLAQTAHYKTATQYESRHYQIGVPVVVMSTVVGTTVFTSLDGSHQGSLAISISVAVVSISAAVLAAIQTFFGYSVRAERHRVAAGRFGVLKRKIERILHFPMDEKEFKRLVLELVRDWDELSKASPVVPQAIWERTCAYYRQQAAGKPHRGPHRRSFLERVRHSVSESWRLTKPRANREQVTPQGERPIELLPLKPEKVA
ncbi:MAG: SLATT domain-containing protein [Thermoanaerobaculia bacterium]